MISKQFATLAIKYGSGGASLTLVNICASCLCVRSEEMTPGNRVRHKLQQSGAKGFKVH